MVKFQKTGLFKLGPFDRIRKILLHAMKLYFLFVEFSFLLKDYSFLLRNSGLFHTDLDVNRLGFVYYLFNFLLAAQFIDFVQVGKFVLQCFNYIKCDDRRTL